MPLITLINVGQSISGVLSATSGRSVGCPTCYADLYQFTLNTTQVLAVTMNSNALDAFLQILDLAGNVLLFDDDSGGGLNARVAATFPPGTYRIEATSLLPGMSGSYTLTLAPLP